MWVKIPAPYTFTPPEERRVSVHYTPGSYSVKRAWGEEMVRRGVAVEIRTPKRQEAAA